MSAASASLGCGGPTRFNVQQTKPIARNSFFIANKQHNNNTVGLMMKGWRGRKVLDGNTNKTTKRVGVNVVRCSGIGLGDFIGGDLVRFDLGRWLSDVEEHKALAIYTPHEGGYEGRYLSRLKRQGYYFLDLSARGLGDPETTLTKIHPVCPVSFLFFNYQLLYKKIRSRYYTCCLWLVAIIQVYNIVSWISGSFRKAANSKVVFPTRSWLQIGSIATKCQRTSGVDHWSQGVI